MYTNLLNTATYCLLGIGIGSHLLSEGLQHTTKYKIEKTAKKMAVPLPKDPLNPTLKERKASYYRINQLNNDQYDELMSTNFTAIQNYRCAGILNTIARTSLLGSLLFFFLSSCFKNHKVT